VYYLPRSLATVKTKRTGGELEFKFEEQVIADVSQRYVLNYQSNPLFKDRLCVMVSNTGYLTSIEYATEDATPRIAVALAELAAKATPGPSASTRSADGAREFDAPSDVPEFSLTFDPLDAQELARVGEEITRRLNPGKRTKYRIDFPDVGSLMMAMRARRQTCEGKGVCFRTKINTMVRVLENDKAVALTTLQLVGPLVGNIDLDRVFLVEKVARLGFNNGALTDVIIKQPSQALQAAKLPLDILDVLLAVPTNFVGNLTGTKAAQDAYVASLESRTAALQRITASMQAIAQRTASENGAEEANSKIFQLSCKGTTLNKAAATGSAGEQG
jgi:hypothetical protein